MNKKIAISLFAGALLLPASAVFAGVVTGVCSNCHTMHNSQNGSLVNAGGAQDKLLSGTGCDGCHARSVGNDSATGKAATDPKAPQVDDAGTYRLNAGYFVKGTGLGAGDSNQHNVYDLGNDKDSVIVGADNAAQPGGAAADVTRGAVQGLGDAATGPALQCASCHTQSGHHNAAANSYRMLSGANTSSVNTNYGVQATIGARSTNVYDATAMNDFCANCHGTFHTAQAGSAAGLWSRHPTDIAVATTAGPSIVALNTGTDTDAVVVGVAGTSDILMCISCHLPHGSAYPDLLSFAYDASNNVAGGTAVSVGCETCHSYSSNGM